MIKLIASDLDGTLLLNGGTESFGRIVPSDKKTKRNGNPFCGGKRAPVCQYEAYVCTSG